MQLNYEDGIEYKERVFFYLSSKILFFFVNLQFNLCALLQKYKKYESNFIILKVTLSLWNH